MAQDTDIVLAQADTSAVTTSTADPATTSPTGAGTEVATGDGTGPAAVEALDGTTSDLDAMPFEPAPAADTTGQVLGALGRAGELMEAGGPVVVILAAMSIFALTIVIAKLVQFSASRMGDRRAVPGALALWRQGREREALQSIRTSRNPAARTLALAMDGLAHGVEEARIREHCYAEAQSAVEALRGWMRPLEVIASLAPLLGLFGTVLGMIEAFGQLEAAGSQVDPAILSGGIWEALLTTAVGLAVAIPVVTAVNWFERRIERVEHMIDTGLASLFSTGWVRTTTESDAGARALESSGSMDLGPYSLHAAQPGE
ncbi:MAG: MotA/TolQ/ExbB proton channel family protein [Pseudomonadota bacterium]